MKIVDQFTAMAPRILGAFRILAGIMFASYGAQKIFDAFGGLPPGVPKGALVWTAGTMELIGGALIAAGLFTRITAFITSGEMAVAYFVGHAPHGFWPIVNHGELAILFCWIFLYFAAQGPGAWALDNPRIRRTQRQAA